MKATFYPEIAMTNHCAIFTKGAKKYRITIKYLHLSDKAIVKIDANYSQYLGYRNRLELFEASGLEMDLSNEFWHDPINNKVLRIEPNDMKIYNLLIPTKWQ